MIKFLDLKAINDSFEPDLSGSVLRVLDSGWYLLGDETKSFEKEYAHFTGTKNCIGVANGLDALRLIFKAYIISGKLTPGDEVIVPANTFIATILAITDNGLIPVLVEPDITNYNINWEEAEKKITAKTRCILAVHLYGQNALNSPLIALADKYNLLLVEDNAQAIGAYFGDKRTGSVGDVAAHSFYPGKNLGCLGDGGAVTTNNNELAELIRAIANYGSTIKYKHDYQGLNSRLDEIQAAVLRVKLKRLDFDNHKRIEIAEYYCNNIANTKVVLPAAKDFFTHSSAEKPTHVWHLFVIRTPEREKLVKYLAENNIQTLIHYPVPPHKQLAYRQWNQMSLPVTEKIHQEVLSIPISQIMNMKEVKIVTEIINNY